MASRLWSWFRSGSSAGAAPRVAARPVVAPSQPMASEAPEYADGDVRSGRAVEASAEELETFLRFELAGRIRELARPLPRDSQGDDGRRLLDDLGGETASVIRRPPMAAQQALGACRDPNASIGQILETFHHDPALTQSLLKHANSAFYSRGGPPCSSLHAAAQRVGLAGLHSVLMGLLVEGMLCRPGNEYGPMVQQIWTHLVRTGPKARRVGRMVNLVPEACYTLGLLHDLGKLIVFDRITAIRAATRHPQRFPPAFLSAVLQELHGPLGGLAALAWNLDPAGARAIASHRRVDLRYRDERMSQVLAVAEWADLTEIREQPRDYEEFWTRASLTLPLDVCRAALDDRSV
jgi:HD-like signal output (HDOD) protein